MTEEQEQFSTTSAGDSYHNIDRVERSGLLKPYIDKKGAANLKLHKYSGSDAGLAYIYFYDPLATWIVYKCPEWIAPNTMTFVGFMHTVAPICVLYCCIGTALIGDVPQWFIYLQAWFYFIYRLLDEMDGKQARRTGNSSALGLIFDHGCDCFAAGYQPLIFQRLMQVGDNLIAKIMTICILSAFHFITLEEYYSGYLFLPMFNGVSDGSIFIIGASLYTATQGNNMWATPLYDGTWLNIDGVTILTLGQIFALAVSLACFLLSCYNVLKIVSYRWYPVKTQVEPVRFTALLHQVASFWIWTAVWLMFQYQGNDPIRINHPPVVNRESAAVDHDALEYGQAYQTVHSLLFIFMIVHQTMSIQLAHCTKSKYQPWGRMITFVISAMLIVTFISYLRNGDVNFKLCITLLCGVTVVFQWQFILSIIGEITTILGIEVFTTKQEQQKRNLKRKLRIQANALKKAGTKEKEGKRQFIIRNLSQTFLTKNPNRFEDDSPLHDGKPYRRDIKHNLSD